MVSVLNNSASHPQIDPNERKIMPPNFQGNYDYPIQGTILRNPSSSQSPISLKNFEVVHEPINNSDAFKHSPHQIPHAESSVEFYRCKYCNFQTSSFNNFLLHGQNIHNQSFKKKFSCDMCTYSAAKRWKVMEHMKYHKKHPGIKLYECQICPFVAPQKHHVDRHIMFIHKDIAKKFQCHICLLELQSKSSLKKHKTAHK